MIIRIAKLLLATGLLATRLALASPGPALEPGEELRYSVSWAIVPGAGSIRVGAEPGQDGQLKVTTTTATRGLARLLLPFDASADARYDVKSGRLLSLHDVSQTRGKHVEHLTTFDYDAHQARYLLVGEPTAKTFAMPEGSPGDLIAALLETRRWQLKPGEKRDSLVIWNDEFYELTIHALRYEDVRTDLGAFRALVLQPRMEKTPPKGMFAKGSTVQVWIAQDERRLPVKFEVEFNIGTGTAELVGYTPPTQAAATPADSGKAPSPPPADPSR